MSIKKFNEDWEGSEEKVKVPGYGDWPNKPGDNKSEESTENNDETLQGLLEVINGLEKLLTEFDHVGMSEDDLKKIQVEVDSLGSTWASKYSTGE
jgi:hypothetical protein